MSKQINTVQGPVSAEELGVTLIHEHFLFGFPRNGGFLPGCYNREEALRTCLGAARNYLSHGVKTVVDATPCDTGRDVELLKTISEQSGLNIVCSTGHYLEAAGNPSYFLSSIPELSATYIYEMFMEEILHGIGKTGIKPGVIKLASSKNRITDYERLFFQAAAWAQKETGVAIITHTQKGTMGPEQADLLIAEGADPGKIAIGHMCGNTDLAYQVRTMDKGVYLAFDRFGIQGVIGTPMDSTRVAMLIELLKLGYTDRLLLSHDIVNFWIGSPPKWPEPVAGLMANWHPAHIFENIIPELKKTGITDRQINKILIENPKKLLGA